MTILGDNIKKLRDERGLTQLQLGEKIGLAESTISLYESGKREPNLATVQLFADYFGKSVDQLLGRNSLSDISHADVPLDEEPTRQDLEEFLRTSNVQFDGTPLDDNDKEELIDVLKFIWGKFNKEKKTPNE
ncbi:helix-turn-helix domain-containing protein [Desulfitobacterium hafniense]|uniref:helix-turn-helix domain-containing protein n=1 Tax=Desulfitobacterium hafniense TaxID=49338 RepID=UPI00035DB5C4|nr:helix-turn-helix transcriptional regulator [Desulfitobacterium hafniense]